MDNKSQNTKNDLCEVDCIHEGVVLQVKQNMLPDETLHEIGDFFKVFGDSTRLKILFALGEQEMCVCDLTAALEMTQSAVSHQLRVLRQSRLVKYRKDGKIVYYSLDDDHVVSILRQGVSHIGHRGDKNERTES